jgi:adenine-specific DNA-methyltransferase
MGLRRAPAKAKPALNREAWDVTELLFKGKEFVFNHHLTVPFRPLEPVPAKGIGPARLDGNLIIHGDNLHGLKALLPIYAGKIDCIFIDPPYNTGNEGWSYNDNVNSPMIKEWLNANPIGIEDGLRHDKWCAMMWPRLRLLHELLAENGSIWITLDDNEAHRAISMLDEIFGEDNFVANISWQKKYSVSNNAIGQASIKDHVVCYAKSRDYIANLLDRTDESEARYSNRDNDPRGPWKAVDYLNQADKEKRPNLCYDIRNPTTNQIVTNRIKAWKFSFETHVKHINDNRLWWGEKGDNSVPALKLYLSEVRGGMTPHDWWPHAEVGHTDEAKKMLDNFDLSVVFDTPKPVRLVARILQIASKPNSIILDSFAGSGTTAHAVLEANKRDGGNRRFILVEGEDYADNLTAERIRRVIKGYSFTGTQKTELLRKPLNWSALKKADALVHEVEGIENLHGHEYDRIKKEVKDGELIVTGEKTVAERAEGLGGEFTYCELGDPVEIDALLSGKSLPTQTALASVLWHMATAQTFDPAAMTSHPAIGEGVARLGEHAGRTYWLIYKSDLAWLKSADAALSLAKARAVAATGEGEHLVFAPAKFVSRDLLQREKLKVDYAPLPFALYKLETA